MIQRTATTTGVLFIIASCWSLQMGAAFAIQLFPIAGPWATTFARLFISGAILLAITRTSIRDFDRSQWSAIIVFGLTIGAMNTTFYAALSRIPLGTAVTIEFIGPLTLSAVLSKSTRDLLWVLIAIAGINLFGWESLFGTGNLDPIGVAFVLIAGFFWAMYILASAKVGRLIPGSGGLALGMLIGSLIPLPPRRRQPSPLFHKLPPHRACHRHRNPRLPNSLLLRNGRVTTSPLRHIRNPLLPRTRLRSILRLATTPPTHQYHQRDRHGARHHRQRGNHN
ncbi:hypothetical protein CIP107573_00527 [Corynebacterium diphtheriae]|nr:hypothetical protein CIP107573_00527 [Corynebacterium diphtheriae]CAB0635239.1 hypothetical protein CIP107563_00547 [Corynebacterium diphtheriae]